MVQLHMVLPEIPQLMELPTQTSTHNMDQDTISITLHLVTEVSTTITMDRVAMEANLVALEEAMVVVVMEIVISQK